MEELWANAAAVIRECLEKAGVRAGRSRGGRLRRPWQRALPARPDRRRRCSPSSRSTAAPPALAEELRADGNGARLHAICLQEPWPSQTPTLLAWVQRHAPELYARAGTAFFCKDFVTFRLTGRRVSDISDMSGAGLLRMPDCTLRRRAARGATASPMPAPCCPSSLSRPTSSAASPPRPRPPPGSPRARRSSAACSTSWRARSARAPSTRARPRSSSAPGASTR